jgi:hypothetical protein
MLINNATRIVIDCREHEASGLGLYIRLKFVFLSEKNIKLIFFYNLLYLYQKLKKLHGLF